jgi:anti-sigma factor RsiW
MSAYVDGELTDAQRVRLEAHAVSERKRGTGALRATKKTERRRAGDA